MNKALTKAVINCYGIAFIAAGLAAIFIFFKIVGGAFILLIAGVQLLRRRPFGLYTALFTSLIGIGIGLMFIGIAVYDLVHHNYRFDGMLMGLVPVIPSFFTLYFFSQCEVAEDFGLPGIRLIDRINKRELIVTARVLLWIIGIVGVVLLACYVMAIMMSR